MQRRNFLQNTALTLGGLAFLNQSTLAAFLQDPTFKIKMLTNEIGMFTERGGTILFMIGKDGLTVVDTQFPDTAGHLITELKKRSEKPFSMVINTHHHGDHSGGNIAFKGLTNTVIAHSNALKNLQAVAARAKTEDKQFFPTETFTDRLTKKVGKERIVLHYFGAGHTNGDIFVHFKKANIVHTGDLVFNRRHPFVDRTAGANIESWIKILDKAQKTFNADTTYIAGHAAEGYDVVMKQADVATFSAYLGNLLKFTEAEVKLGKSFAEIKKATAIPGSPEWKGTGIERPLQAAYEEITGTVVPPAPATK